MINIKRKLELAKNRKSLSEETWSNYLEQAYPEWWKKDYSNKWKASIVYYPSNYSHNKNTISSSYIFEFYVNKFSTLNNIILMFNKFLACQKRAIMNCFGNDIGEMIYNYLPKNFEPKNNYLYVHKRGHKKDNEGYIIPTYQRYIPSPDTKYAHLYGKLNHQDTSELKLRLRANPLLTNTSQFWKENAY